MLKKIFFLTSHNNQGLNVVASRTGEEEEEKSYMDLGNIVAISK